MKLVVAIMLVVFLLSCNDNEDCRKEFIGEFRLDTSLLNESMQKEILKNTDGIL